MPTSHGPQVGDTDRPQGDPLMSHDEFASWLPSGQRIVTDRVHPRRAVTPASGPPPLQEDNMRSRYFALLPALLILMVGIVATGYAVGRRVLVGAQQDGSFVVPNGQTLTPAGTHIEVNDRP